MGERKRRGRADSCYPGSVWSSGSNAAWAARRGQVCTRSSHPWSRCRSRASGMQQPSANPQKRRATPNTQPHTQEPLLAPPTLLQGRQLLLEPVHVLLQVVHAVDEAWGGAGKGYGAGGTGRVTGGVAEGLREGHGKGYGEGGYHSGVSIAALGRHEDRQQAVPSSGDASPINPCPSTAGLGHERWFPRRESQLPAPWPSRPSPTWAGVAPWHRAFNPGLSPHPNWAVLGSTAIA